MTAIGTLIAVLASFFSGLADLDLSDDLKNPRNFLVVEESYQMVPSHCP
jgi:hypothetical protein